MKSFSLKLKSLLQIAADPEETAVSWTVLTDSFSDFFFPSLSLSLSLHFWRKRNLSSWMFDFKLSLSIDTLVFSEWFGRFHIGVFVSLKLDLL